MAAKQTTLADRIRERLSNSVPASALDGVSDDALTSAFEGAVSQGSVNGARSWATSWADRLRSFNPGGTSGSGDPGVLDVVDSSGGTSDSGSVSGAGNPTLDFTVPAVTKETLADVYGVTGFNDPYVAQKEAEINKDIAGIRDLGRGFLTGELPADVSEAVRKASTAGSLARGIVRDSGMSRNLTARDLGLTSLQLMESGSQILNSASSFDQSRIQYKKQYDLAEAELQNQIRSLNLSEAQLAQAKHEFKNKTVLALNSQLISLATFREELNLRYATTTLSGDVSMAEGPLQTIDSMLDQLVGTLDL